MSEKDAALPVKLFGSANAWEKWLEARHAKSLGIWIKLAKRDSGIASITYAEALDIALCFGWIDGRKEAGGERHWLQKFTPRTAKSRWSKINCEKVAKLEKDGRMRQAGLDAVAKAKADGRWTAAYDSPSRATVPEDLARALAKNTKARTFFETLQSHNRYAILYRVHDAKKPETRARRISTFVEMLERGETIHPAKRPSRK
jgi:uncharacterized protein YdeI (YjbR/CyaY-like superfamily)